MKISNFIYLSAVAMAFFACNPSDEPDKPITPEESEVAGVYVLNEGNVNGNNASLSFFEYASGNFTANIFDAVNPSAGGIGDTGTDLKIYGSKLYAVVQESNLVEVMDAATARHIATIPVEDCRYIAFDGGFAYVSSYAGAVYGGAGQVGFVAKIDTAQLAVTAQITVGRQPDELAVANGKLYVANSGGYETELSNEISVINLAAFQVEKTITLGVPNLTKIRTDKNGNLWVVSSGNYYDIQPSISILNPKNESVKTLNISVSNFDFYEDKIYYFNYSYITMSGIFGIIDINTQAEESGKSFLAEAAAQELIVPYGLAVNPHNGDIFVSDALDYASPGKIYCYDKDGKKKWTKTAGICPAHFTFVR